MTDPRKPLNMPPAGAPLEVQREGVRRAAFHQANYLRFQREQRDRRKAARKRERQARKAARSRR
jgi:hypothetical protein